MEERKSLLVDLAETLDRHLPHRATPTEHPLPKSRNWLRWLGKQLLPNLGSIIIMLILLYTFPGLAAPNQAPTATSISTIPYQGRLADAGGNPVTGMQNMEFRIYDVPTGGTPLWEEFWTGGNSVSVSDGLFSVLLGSLNTNLVSVVQGHEALYLGVTVGTDTEMSPRVQLGSVPFSMQALTVPDSSVTTAKIADGAVTQAKAPTLVAGQSSNQQIRVGIPVITTDGNGQAWISFSVPFPSNVYNVVAINGDYGADGGLGFTAHAGGGQDKTGFTIRLIKDDGTILANRTVRINYIAVGH